MCVHEYIVTFIVYHTNLINIITHTQFNIYNIKLILVLKSFKIIYFLLYKIKQFPIKNFKKNQHSNIHNMIFKKCSTDNCDFIK